MKKTFHQHASPLIVLAIFFCVAGVGLFGYFYHSDYQEQQLAKDETLSTKLIAQKTNTVYQVSDNLINNPTNLPPKITIMGDVPYQKNNIVSYNDIFHASWAPLLIIGTYILVHARNGIESKTGI